MSKAFVFILLFLPALLFSEEQKKSGVLQIDVIVKVVSPSSEELWSVDLRRYTVSGRSISVNLKGFDGELKATMTPIITDDDTIILIAKSQVKSVGDEKIINESEIELKTKFNEEIILYPIGNIKNVPNVILELNITKFNGVGVWK